MEALTPIQSVTPFFFGEVGGSKRFPGRLGRLQCVFLTSVGLSSYLGKPHRKKISVHMGSSAQDGENEQYLALFFFFWALLWPNGLIFWSFVNCSEEILTVRV